MRASNERHILLSLQETAMSRTQIWVLIGLVLVVLAYFGIQASRADYLAFDRQREAWHRRCDAYVGKATSDPRADDCKRELDELMAYAKRKGWGN
jgi:hypothetical protein